MAIAAVLFAPGSVYAEPDIAGSKPSGPKVLAKADTARAPGWLTSPHDGTWEVKGNALTIETTPFRSMRDGVEVIAIVQCKRK